MGWFALAIVAIGSGAALWLAGMPRSLLTAAAAALALAGAGYAWQGRPLTPANPVAMQASAMELNPGMLAFRAAVLRPSDPATMAAADAAIRRGAPEDAVAALLNAVAQRPNDAALWTWLGVAYAASDGGQLSAAAKFAFARAMRLAPREPGPPFFLGLSAFDARDLDTARAAWAQALALTSKDATYREDIALRLRLANAIAAMQARAPK
jgi:cytochrome c-type biogenesis protein CcmH